MYQLRASFPGQEAYFKDKEFDIIKYVVFELWFKPDAPS